MLVVCVFKMNNRNLRQRNVNRQLNNDRPPDRQAKLDGLEFIAKLFENKKDAKGNVVEKSKLQKLVDDEKDVADKPSSDRLKSLFKEPPPGKMYIDNPRQNHNNQKKVLFQNINSRQNIDRNANIKKGYDLKTINPAEFYLLRDKKFGEELNRNLAIADEVFKSKFALQSDYKPGYMGSNTPLSILFRDTKKHRRFNPLLRKGGNPNSQSAKIQAVTGAVDPLQRFRELNEFDLRNRMGVRGDNYVDPTLRGFLDRRRHSLQSNILFR